MALQAVKAAVFGEERFADFESGGWGWGSWGGIGEAEAVVVGEASGEAIGGGAWEAWHASEQPWARAVLGLASDDFGHGGGVKFFAEPSECGKSGGDDGVAFAFFVGRSGLEGGDFAFELGPDAGLAVSGVASGASLGDDLAFGEFIGGILFEGVEAVIGESEEGGALGGGEAEIGSGSAGGGIGGEATFGPAGFEGVGERGSGGRGKARMTI